MPFIKKFATYKKKKEKSSDSKEAAQLTEEDYAKQREVMVSRNEGDRLSLARNPQAHKEILYYLAEKDPSPEVRRAVANNPNTPVQASKFLVQDNDEDVRLALARRLTGLLPELSQDKQSQLYAFAVQALGTLAIDEVLKIRIALSSTLKDHAHTPPKIAGQLARDVEREVSEPILRFCAALSDEDLLDILRGHPSGWVVEAIAEREQVSEDVSDAVIEIEHRAGGTALIMNQGAKISEGTLVTIVEKSKEFSEWQKPVASRKQLPVSIAKQLASFVDSSVRDILLSRGDFDISETEEIAAIFRRRVDFASEEEKKTESVEERVKRLEKEDRLNEETISDALAMRDYAFVSAALGRMLGVTAESIVNIMDARAPKSIVSISWKAGLSVRMALQLQKDMANIHHTKLLYPKDGTEYPLEKDEMLWQLDFLGLKK